MAFFIKAKNAAEAWPKILRTIMDSGSSRTKDEWGSDTKEALNLVVNLREPSSQEGQIPVGYSWTKEKLEEYAKKEFLSSDKHGFEYTYGQRLLDYGGINQVQEIINRLKRSPSTRRAVAVSWSPPLDTKSEEVPCLVLWDWKLRDGCLHMTTIIRSNDMYGAWPANVFGLNRLLEHVAKEVGVKPGEITTHSISAHIYSRDFDLVNKILGR